jgi:protein KTI12
VHVGTPVDKCIATNDARLRRDAEKENPSTDAPASETKDTPANTDNEEAYPSELLNNLIFRYEEPSTHSRWDKPLFTVPYDDPTPPVPDIFEALTGVVLPTAETPSLPSLTTNLAATTISDNASTATATKGGRTLPSRRIVPHQATVQATATDSNAMYAMEKRTSAVVTAIRNFTTTHPTADIALAQSSVSDRLSIPVPDVSTPVLVPSHVLLSGTTEELAGAGGVLALPRLQRLRRQWISLNRSYIGFGHSGGALTVDQIGDAFVRFLNAEFSGAAGELED